MKRLDQAVVLTRSSTRAALICAFGIAAALCTRAASQKVVSPATVRAMFTDLAPMDQGCQTFYGRGVQLYDIPQGPGLMLGHSGGVTGFTSIVAYVPDDNIFVSVIFNDEKIPAEAGLWAIVRALRAVRQAG